LRLKNARRFGKLNCIFDEFHHVGICLHAECFRGKVLSEIPVVVVSKMLLVERRTFCIVNIDFVRVGQGVHFESQCQHGPVFPGPVGIQRFPIAGVVDVFAAERINIINTSFLVRGISIFFWLVFLLVRILVLIVKFLALFWPV